MKLTNRLLGYNNIKKKLDPSYENFINELGTSTLHEIFKDQYKNEPKYFYDEPKHFYTNKDLYWSFWSFHGFPGILNFRGKRCKCNSTISITKKQEEKDPGEKKKSSIRKSSIRTIRPLFSYPKLPLIPLLKRPIILKPSGTKMKTFQIKYEKNLSSIAKVLLNSFQNRYLYYAIDDILYSLKSDSIERDNVLSILYSPILSLQNNLSINFFDIWIHDVCIEKKKNNNKFLVTNIQYSESISYITIKLLYTTRNPIKKQETLW